MGQAKRKGTNREERVEAILSAHSAKSMTSERYNAFVSWTRSPIASLFGEELEFFSSIDEHLIAVLFRDHEDKVYGYAILGRDAKRRFRAIDVETCIGIRNDARKLLLRGVKKRVDSEERVFPQDDEVKDKSGVDLFKLAVPEAKANQFFMLLRSDDHWIPARLIMSEMMHHFRDVDGNFVEQLQTTGFDSRIWELYLYAALLEEGLFVEKPTPAPDFKVSRGGADVFIEAVTVNPSPNDPVLKPYDQPIERTPEEIQRLSNTKIAIKFGSALWSKLTRNKPYWEIPEVSGRPLIFAIADFHEKQSMTWTSTALISYLYGVDHDFTWDKKGQLIISPAKIAMHEYEGKKIPSGFFLLPNSEHISAVLFSASGTLSKFNRMGKLAGFGRANQKMFRMGTRHKHDRNSALPEPFFFEVEQGKVTETWAEGLSMFHNPQAKRPVDPDMFPNVAHHHFDGGQIVSYLPEFHPYGSYTWNILPERKESAGQENPPLTA